MLFITKLLKYKTKIKRESPNANIESRMILFIIGEIKGLYGFKDKEIFRISK